MFGPAVIAMSKPVHILPSYRRFIALLFLLLIAGCGGGGDSRESSGPSGSDPAFSMPLPKGLWAPLPNSDLTLAAIAVVDPGAPDALTKELQFNPATNRVAGSIEGVPEGPHTVEIRYFINQVLVATAALNVNVVPGQNNPVEVAPAAIRYVEAVSDALFVADADDGSIKIFDRYSNLKGGVIQPAPTRTLRGENTGIGRPSSGSLFVDSIGGGLYFADTGANVIRIWNAATANDNVPPDRVLEGGATELLQPSGIAFDPFRNRLYVVNGPGKILIWKNAGSISGDVSPTAVVSVAATGLVAGDHPIYLDVKTDTLYVADGSQILVFEKLGSLTGEQEAAPARIIEIAGGRLSQAGVAGDPFRDLLFVSSRDPDGKIYQVTGASAASAQIAPAATLAGAETGLSQTSTVTLAGNVLMALNLGGSQIRVWHQADQKDGNASPTQILELGQTALPEALFYVATQNGERDQAEHILTIQKSGDGRITSDLPGINCGTTCSAPFRAGDIVTLTAVARGDSFFNGWGGACNGTGLCVVTMDAAKSVTATFTFGDTQTVRLNPAADTFLNLDASVNSTSITLNTYTWPANRIANAVLMKFDLSGLPAGATIQSATLNLALIKADAASDATYTISVHKIINKNPDVAQATGYTYNGTNEWTASNCCSDNVPLAQADISAAYDTEGIDKTLGSKVWDVTAMAHEWVSSPTSNFGLLVNSDPTKEADRYRTFASMEHPDVDLRPYLSITYAAAHTASPVISSVVPQP